MCQRTLRAYSDSVRTVHRIVDLLVVLLAHALTTAAPGPLWQAEQTSALVFVLVAFTVASELIGVYRSRTRADLVTEASPVLLAWAMTGFALGIFWLATVTPAPSTVGPPFPLAWLLSTAATVVAWRAAEHTLLRLLARWQHTQRVAIVGATAAAERVFRELRDRPWRHMRVVGVYDDRGEARRRSLAELGARHVGGFLALLEACRRGEIDVVYVALPLVAEQRIAGMLQALSNTTASVFLVADLPAYDLLSARWTALGSCPLLSIHDTPFRGLAAGVKRAEDVVAGIVAVVLIAIPLVVIAILVKLTSRGPVFFRQRRYGLNGAEIRVLKFRTMTVCEDGPRVQQAQRNDARVTRLGRFLRKTSLDELPQFLQVLTGEMSVVGPRPHAVAHNEHYRSLIPRYMLRHKIKPGITGWAQVNGWRGETPTLDRMEKRIEHDLAYINNWSLLLDLKIVFLTVWGRRTRRNAF